LGAVIRMGDRGKLEAELYGVARGTWGQGVCRISQFGFLGLVQRPDRLRAIASCRGSGFLAALTAVER